MATSYDNPGGKGDRTGSITVTSSPSAEASITNFVDGSFFSSSTGSTYFSSGNAADRYIRFNFGIPRVVDEATWYQSTTDELGTWKWQGSNDGSTWTDIGSSFTLGGATTQVQTELAGNTTPYRYYQLLGVSGTYTNNPWLQEVEFKIDDNYPDIPKIESFSTNTVSDDTTLTVTKPDGTVEGDMLVAFFLCDRAATEVTVPDGWAAYYEEIETANRSYAIYYKFAGASEPADYTFTTNDTGGIVIGIVRISGAEDFDGIEITVGDTGTSVTAPSLTTTVDNCLIFRAAFFSWSSTFGTWSKGVELWDMRHTSSSVNTGGAQCVAWDVQPTAGATGTADITVSATSYHNIITLAIAPVSGDPDPDPDPDPEPSLMDPPLYDEFVSGDIVGAWGLRQLISTYDGPLVRIRDTDDNSEQDVGFDENGELESFTVVGDAAVTTLYDQSGNGSDLVSTTASQQPILLLGVTPTGGPAIKFDGSDDFLRDGTLGTTRPYMVETPTMIFAGGGSPGGDNNGALATIPHSQPSNGSPWQRFGVLRNSGAATTVALYRDGSSSTMGLRIFRPSDGWGAFVYSPVNGRLYDCVEGAQDLTFTADTSISYPSSTGFCIGGTGTADNWSGYFTECAIIDDDAPDADELRAIARRIKSDYFTVPKQVWRIVSTLNFSGSASSHAFREWELAESPGGDDVTVSGQNWFQSQSASNEPASRLFDNGNNGWWSDSSPAGPYTVGVDLNTGYEIVEMRLTNGSSANAMPRNFTIAYLAPGATWVEVADVDLTSEGTAIGKVFTIAIEYPEPGFTVDPNEGSVLGGTEVTLSGVGLTDATGVLFGTEPATDVVVVNDTEITCTTPAQTSTGAVDVTVEIDGGDDIVIEDAFTYVVPDLEVVPNTGPSAGGQSVTIYGEGFTGATGVLFDTDSATSVVVVDDYTITAETPAHDEGLVDVTVQVSPSDIVIEDAYTFADGATPEVTSIVPSSGTTEGGTAVTITGTNLTNTHTVLFGEEEATDVTVVNDTEVTCVTPAHASGVVDVMVENFSGSDVVEDGFEFKPPMHVSQVPVLFMHEPNQQVRASQIPLLVVNLPVQGAKITQIPVLPIWAPKPVPLPLPVIPDVPIVETWEYKTVLTITERSKEQRSQLRGEPRFSNSFSVTILDDEDRRDIYQMLMKFISSTFNYPMFVYALKLSAAAEQGDTKLYFNPAYTDMRAGEGIALYDPQQEASTILTIESVDADGVTLTEPLSFDVPAYYHVVPAPTYRTQPVVGFQMNAIDGTLDLRLLGVDSRQMLRPGQATNLLTTLDGIPLVDKRPLANDGVGEEFDQNVEWVDNSIAPAEPRTNWYAPFIRGNRSFLIHRPEGMDYWRLVAHTLKGRQNTFLLPTFRHDMPLLSQPSLGATQITSPNIQFGEIWRSKAWRYLRLESRAGVRYVRINEVITNYNPAGDPVSITIKLSTSIGVTEGSNEDMVISFVNTCRLDSDEIVIEHGLVDSVLTMKVRLVEE